jgi:uncharacterized protein YbjT (DUF2867 family)
MTHASTSNKVLISGATGDTGRAAVREAIALGLGVRAIVHNRDARSEALETLGAEVVFGDLLEIDTVRAAMEGTHAAYLVWPVAPGLIHVTVNFAQAAKEAGVSTVINLSQRSANRFSTSHSCRDSFIAEQVLNWSGLPVIHLRPTYFLEWLLYPWQLPYLRQGILRMPVGKGRHSPIAADDQGRVIAALLKSPDGHVEDDSNLRSGRDGPRADSGGTHRGTRAQDCFSGSADRRILPFAGGDGRSALHRAASRWGHG